MVEDQNKKTSGFETFNVHAQKKMKKLSCIILMDHQFPSQEFDMFSPYELSSKIFTRFNPFFLVNF
jgi:hypothetical protein